MVGYFFQFAAVGRIPLKVHHGTDGTGLHFHQHQAAPVDVGQGVNLLAECPVGQFLDVNVDCGAQVQTVNGLHIGAVEVAHAAVVGHTQALAPVFTVQHCVEAALEADVGVGHSGGVVAYEADGSAGQTAVGVFADEALLLYVAALVGAFAEQRELLHCEHGVAVDATGDGNVLAAFRAAFLDEGVVLFGGFAREGGCQ